MIRTVPIEEAVGFILSHDITEIRPGEFKGPAFRRGHKISYCDIEHLRRLGKEHLFVIDPDPEKIHEEEAAFQLARALCGEGVRPEGPPREGKISIVAERSGILKVDVDALTRFNSLGDVMCATIHTNTIVKEGEMVGATRAIPLLIDRSVIDKAVRIAMEPKGILKVFPLKNIKAGVLITGNEIYYRRIQDRFEPVMRNKVEALGGKVIGVSIVRDDEEDIALAVSSMLRKGADLIIITGGLSVDPDDKTRLGIMKSGAKEILYGSSVLPGSMLMIAYIENVPVIGVPACALYAKATSFDLVYPRILAGEMITRNDLSRLGHGGLCRQCDICRYPLCPFGKGT